MEAAGFVKVKQSALSKWPSLQRNLGLPGDTPNPTLADGFALPPEGYPTRAVQDTTDFNSRSATRLVIDYHCRRAGAAGRMKEDCAADA